jgi:excisionase family DNA binding protein
MRWRCPHALKRNPLDSAPLVATKLQLPFCLVGWRHYLMAHQLLVGGEIICPLCKESVQLLRIQQAAKLAGVSRRTIYRYIEEGRIFAAKIAGRTYRVCNRCLIKPDFDPKPESKKRASL